jgi:hypothetical protein
LDDYEPKIWRAVSGDEQCKRWHGLGYIIMTLFEMQASHLFSFDVPYAENYRMCVGNGMETR